MVWVIVVFSIARVAYIDASGAIHAAGDAMLKD